ncbi:MAG: hypothetical protein MI975_05075 [Cytophagales bacterium]|nr:hypothetical protein [Cytophagales bacterium]
MKTGSNKFMRTLILILGIIVGLAGLAYAQEGEEELGRKDQMQTLFGFDAKITGYGSLESKFTRLNAKDAVVIGGHGGVIFNRYFYFGLGAYGLVTSNKHPGSFPEESLDLEMGYTGLMMGFNIMPKKVVHFSIPLFVGVGNLELEHKNVFIENSAFFLLEPGLQLELNVVRFMKIGLGGSYRLVHGSNLRNNISDDDLSYWSGNFALIFGKFN